MSWLRVGESASALPQFYHGTSSANLPRIRHYGLHMPYLTVNLATAEYFAQAEVEVQAGDHPDARPVILVVTVPDADMLTADRIMLSDPVGVDISEEEIEDALATMIGEPTWQDSLDMTGSVRYEGDIPAEAVREYRPGEDDELA